MPLDVGRALLALNDRIIICLASRRQAEWRALDRARTCQAAQPSEVMAVLDAGRLLPGETARPIERQHLPEQVAALMERHICHRATYPLHVRVRNAL